MKKQKKTWRIRRAEMGIKYILGAILLSAVITFVLRALPFVIFNGKK